MRNKKAKLLSICGVTLALTSTLLTSCGVKSFEQQFDGKVNILVGWDKNDIQAKAVSELVRVYNETQKNTEDFLEVELNNIESGHGGVFRTLSNGLKTKDANNFYNLTFHYQTVLAYVNGFHQSLSFDNNAEYNDKWGIDKNRFEEDFLTINNKVGGLPKNRIYAIPLIKSTLVNAINMPILSYVLETMVSFGAKIDPKDLDWYEQVKKAGANDRNYIKNLWGEPVESERLKYKNMVISKDKIFNYGVELIDFAINAQQLFKNSHNNPSGTLHFLGLNDMYNFLSLLVYSMTANGKEDYENFFTRLKPDGYLDYSAFNNPASKTYEAFQKITKKVLEAAKIGAFYVKNRAPAYLLRRHMIGAAIAATSSYEANFYQSDIKPNTFYLNIDKNGNKDKFEIPEANVFNLEKLQQNNMINNALVRFNSLGNRYQIYDSKAALKKENLSKNIKSKDQKTDDKIKEFLNKWSNDVNIRPVLIINSQLEELWKTQKDKLVESHVELLGIDINDKQIFGILNPAQIQKNKALDLELFSDENSLQETELYTINPPRKWDTDSKISTVFLQGASLLGIKANKREDKATRKFVNWLSSEDKFAFKFLKKANRSEMEYKKEDESFTNNANEAKKIKPMEYVLRATNYITPWKGFFNEVTNSSNPFSSFAFNEIKNVKANENWAIYEEPADELTNAFRSAVGESFHIVVNQYLEGSSKNLKGTYKDDVLPKINLLKNNFGL